MNWASDRQHERTPKTIMAAAPGLMKVTLKLKRPADEEAHDERRCKPRVAPPSEDLEAAKALSGLFAAAPPESAQNTT